MNKLLLYLHVLSLLLLGLLVTRTGYNKLARQNTSKTKGIIKRSEKKCNQLSNELYATYSMKGLIWIL